MPPTDAKRDHRPSSVDEAAELEGLLTQPSLELDTRFSAQLMLGRVAFHMGEVHRAGDQFQAVASAAGVDYPDYAIKALLDHTLQSWAYFGPRAALPVAVRARALATGDDPYYQVCAEAAWALCAWLSGDAAGLDAAEEAARGDFLPETSAPGTTLWGLDPAAVPADIAVWAEHFSLGEGLLSETLRLAEERAEPFLLFHAALSSSDAFCRLGRLEEALAMAERACDVAELLPIALPLARAAKGMALVEAGRLDEAAACEDPPAGPQWYLAKGYQLRLRATLAHRQGRIDTACSIFNELEECIAEWGVADPSHIPYAADAIAAYLAARRLDEGRRVVARLKGCQLPSRWPAAVAIAGEAQIVGYEGDLLAAETGLARALDLLQDIPMPLARCRVLTSYGAVMTRRGEPERARPVLTRAVQEAQARGAGWYSGQVLAELRRAGGRMGRIAPGQLSPQEKAVARLARAGRTNREISRELFLSINTVETHLSHIYRKLGIGRRRDLEGVDLT